MKAAKIEVQQSKIQNVMKTANNNMSNVAADGLEDILSPHLKHSQRWKETDFYFAHF